MAVNVRLRPGDKFRLPLAAPDDLVGVQITAEVTRRGSTQSWPLDVRSGLDRYFEISAEKGVTAGWPPGNLEVRIFNEKGVEVWSLGPIYISVKR